MSTLKDKNSGMTAASAGLPVRKILTAISSWEDLSEAQRRDMASGVRRMARVVEAAEVGRRGPGGAPLHPLDVWTCGRLNAALWSHPPSFFGLSPRRFANVVGLVRAVLIRLGLHADAGPWRNELAPGWQALFDALPTDDRRRGLVLFFRFCSLEGMEPGGVAADAIDRFEAWCREAILCKDAAGMARRAAGNWTFARGAVPGWPDVALCRSGIRDWYALPWEELPESFRADAECYLDRLRQGPGSIFSAQSIFRGGTRSSSPRGSCRALRPETIKRRRYDLKLAATALVASGVPLEELVSLRSLLEPVERFVTILVFHRERRRRRLFEAGEAVIDDDGLRSSLLTSLADTLRQVGLYHLELPEEAMEFIRAGSAEVKPPAQAAMTEKNATRLRALFEPCIYAKLIHLPEAWMRRAADPGLKPRDAALWAMYAGALEVLLVCPLRKGNLIRLTLDRHLRRPSPAALIGDILIPAAEVKNREPIAWRIEPESARRLETYINKYRPHLAEAGNRFLFPSGGDRHRNETEFGVELGRRVEWELGVPFNVHLARHFAVARWLRANPGAYEMAARIVGHRSVATTMSYYSGLEFDQTARHSNAILTGERTRTRTIAAAAFTRMPRNPPRPAKPGPQNANGDKK